jgi:hypothetical protein
MTDTARDGVPILGVDIGGVIVDRVAEREDTSFFGTRPLETPSVLHAFDLLRKASADLFAGRVVVVSKAGPAVEANTRAWLAHHRFFEHTGIPPGSLYFVRERADKALICREVGVTHFVDDELDVLCHMTSVPHRYLFIGGLGHNDPPQHIPGWAVLVATWRQLVAELHKSMAHPTVSW